MPYGDRTGPLGDGPRTGRRMGLCSGSGHPGYMVGGRRMHAGLGRGKRGRGRGFGKGFGFGRFMFSPENEQTFLKERIEFLEEELRKTREMIENREEEEN